MKIKPSTQPYILTPTARKNLREAKIWSLNRWGEKLTTQYFHDLEQAAIYLSAHHKATSKKEFAGESELNAYPVREHYIIYTILDNQKIAIISFIRQTRDIPSLLSKYSYLFKRELEEIKRKNN